MTTKTQALCRFITISFAGIVSSGALLGCNQPEKKSIVTDAAEVKTSQSLSQDDIEKLDDEKLLQQVQNLRPGNIRLGISRVRSLTRLIDRTIAAKVVVCEMPGNKLEAFVFVSCVTTAGVVCKDIKAPLSSQPLAVRGTYNKWVFFYDDTGFSLVRSPTSGYYDYELPDGEPSKGLSVYAKILEDKRIQVVAQGSLQSPSSETSPNNAKGEANDNSNATILISMQTEVTLKLVTNPL